MEFPQGVGFGREKPEFWIGVGPAFFFNDTATTEIYTLSLHDALPIYHPNDTLSRELRQPVDGLRHRVERIRDRDDRSEEHTSELQSRGHLVCRLLLEKKKKKKNQNKISKKNKIIQLYC